MLENCRGDRQHDHGRSHIRDPHRNRGSDAHEAEGKGARRGADPTEHQQGDAVMELPLLHRQGDEKTAHEQEDHLVCVGGRHFLWGENV